MVGADVLGRPPHAQGRRRWTMRPRGPPRTSAPTNTARTAGPRIISCGAQGRIHGRGGRPRPPAPRTHRDDAGGRCVRAGRRGRRPLPTPHSRGVQNRTHHVARRTVYMVGADVLGRPPRACTGTTPVDDASTRAAEDVGPYQRRTAVVCRAAHTSCGAQGRIHGRGGRPRPPAPPARTGTTPVDDASARATGDVGPYQHRTAVMCRAARTMWRAGRRCARHTYRCGISSPV